MKRPTKGTRTGGVSAVVEPFLQTHCVEEVLAAYELAHLLLRLELAQTHAALRRHPSILLLILTTAVSAVAQQFEPRNQDPTLIYCCRNNLFFGGRRIDGAAEGTGCSLEECDHENRTHHEQREQTFRRAGEA